MGKKSRELKKWIYRFFPKKVRLNKKLQGKKYIDFNKSDFMYWQKKYPAIIEMLRQKAKSGEKIRIGFVVMWNTSFSAESVLEKMLNNSIFDSKIIVVPVHNIYTEDEKVKVYKHGLEIIKSKFENKCDVLEGYDEKTNKVVDYTSDFDILFIPSNDERIFPDEYKIYNLINKNILVCYVCYAFYAAKDNAINSDTYNLCWKVFVENQLNYEDLILREQIGGYNAYISGYVKTDKFAGLKKISHKSKQIIIAPHHSVHEKGFCSRFLQYADFFLQLPKLYPDINFIFRPHPLLMNTLIQGKYWSEEKVKNYLDELMSNSNVIYDTTVDYYQTFLNSDGIIHDCGSFTPEALLSGSPCCYMLKDKNIIQNYFNVFGQKCLEHYYQAFHKDDIIRYIEMVVLKGDDPKKSERDKFVNECIKVNWLNVSEKIINYLEKQIA